MRSRSRVVAVGCAALCAAAALALSWTWTGEGVDDRWDTCDNWDLSYLDPEPCWPSTQNDSVTFPALTQQDPWAVYLIDATIGKTTVKGSVHFRRAGEQAVTLSTHPLSIQAPLAAEVELVVLDTGAEIRTW